eukprot:572174-Hanusia_phi.AAC.1
MPERRAHALDGQLHRHDMPTPPHSQFQLQPPGSCMTGAERLRAEDENKMRFSQQCFTIRILSTKQ